MKKETYRMKYDSKVWHNPWRRYESYCTTTQFHDLGPKGYVRHCGPTAVTNLIRAIKGREGQPLLETEDTTFSRLAALGSHLLVYLNADVFGIFGGTSDLLSGIYLRQALKQYKCKARVIGRHFLNEKNVKAAVERGSILYVEFHRHPKYRNHHIICYSAEELLVRSNQKEVEFYLRCADGWSKEPQYLSLLSVPFGNFIEIGME